MKSRLTSILFISVAIVSLIIATGCCRKPPEELGMAQSAVAQAKENCAEVYAKDEYKKAYDALSMAEKFNEDRKCKDTRNSANEAIALAAEAEMKANEVKADLDSKAKAKMAAIDKCMADLMAKSQTLLAKKAEADAKKAEYTKSAEEKEFGKYDVGLELPTPYLDNSLQTDGQTFMADYEKIKAMYNEGDCNLIEVNAALDKLTPECDKMAAKMAANIKALDDMMAKMDAVMEARLAELAEAMKPKYMTAYTVVKGDSLWKIAEMELVYNDPFQWPLIWWENKYTDEKAMNMSKEDRFNLIKDPDLIFPNQNLKIKQEMGQDEIDDAIKYAKNRYGNVSWRDIPDFMTDGK